MKFVLDEKNTKIINMLKNNARESFTDIAKSLSLSEGAVRKRVKSLVENGIVKRFTIETNEALYPVRSVVMVKLNSKAPIDRILEFVSKIQGVNSAHSVTGGYDIMVEIGASNTNELHDKIMSIRNQKGVASTMTMTILS